MGAQGQFCGILGLYQLPLERDGLHRPLVEHPWSRTLIFLCVWTLQLLLVALLGWA